MNSMRKARVVRGGCVITIQVSPETYEILREQGQIVDDVPQPENKARTVANKARETSKKEGGGDE